MIFYCAELDELVVVTEVNGILRCDVDSKNYFACAGIRHLSFFFEGRIEYSWELIGFI